MVFGRLRLALVGLGVLWLIAASAPVVALADHCGADGLVTPASGPVGTVFVIEPRLGDATDLGLYRNGQLRIKVYLVGDRVHRGYVFRSKPGDEGRWEARAWVRHAPQCRSEAAFTVTGLPDTATVGDSGRSGALALLASAVGIALTLAWLLRPRRAGA